MRPPFAISVLLLALAVGTVVPVQARQTDQERAVHAERSLVRGLTYLQTGRVEDAIAVLSEALRLNPDHPALLVSMAEAQAAAGDAGAALFHVRRAREQAPDEPDVLRAFRDISLTSGDAPAARDAAEALVDLRPDDPRALEDLMRLLLQMDQVSDAVALDVRAETTFPDHMGLLEVRADALERAGETARLAPVLERLRPFRPVDARLAAAYVRLGRPDDAARLWLLADDSAEARAALDALRPEITDPEVLAALDARGPATDTEEALRARIAADPRNTTLLVELATKQLEREAWGEAGETIERLVNLDARQLDLWVEGVAALGRAGEPARAVALGRDALVLYPGYGPLMPPLISALVATGQRDEAVRMARSALERARDDDAWAAPVRDLLQSLDSPQ